MSHLKVILKNNQPQNITNDLGEEVALSAKEVLEKEVQSLEWKGEKVLPKFPKQRSNNFGYGQRFIATAPRQELIESATYGKDGNVTKDAVMGDWEMRLITPDSFDPSTLKYVAEIIESTPVEESPVVESPNEITALQGEQYLDSITINGRNGLEVVM